MSNPQDNDQVRLARAYVTQVAAGGLDPSHYAPDMTVWTTTTGLISREAFLPRQAAAKEVWREPLAMTIDSVTAQPGRVVNLTAAVGQFAGREFALAQQLAFEFVQFAEVIGLDSINAPRLDAQLHGQHAGGREGVVARS